jgi:DNA-binding response OmpR family regulator
MNSTVLIVDDSLTVRMDLSDAFSSGGFRVQPCGTAREALEILRARALDVVVLDVLLPDGNGVDLLKEIRASALNGRDIVLMLSSEAEV